MDRLLRSMFWVLAVLSATAAGCAVDSPPASAPSAATEEPTPTGEPVPLSGEPALPAPSEPDPATDPTTTAAPSALPTAAEVQFWARQGHVNPVAYSVAALFNIDEDPEPFSWLFHRDDPDAADALQTCFDEAVRQRLGGEVVDDLFGDPTSLPSNIEAIRADGAEVLLECVDPLLVRDRWIGASIDGWNIYGPNGARLVYEDSCVQQGYSNDPTEFGRQWLAELRDELPSEMRVCQDSAPGWTAPLDAATASRFCIEACQRDLADVFVATDDPAQRRNLRICFHRALRGAVGDDAVDQFASLNNPSPERNDVARAASAVLFDCVPGDQIRAAAIATNVDSWNTYVKPSGAPLIEHGDPCVQQLFPTESAAFRAVWIGQLEVGSADVRAGTCLFTTSIKELGPLSSVEAQPSALAGRHTMTLQWISWEPDQWGAIEFTPADDGTYWVEGRQDGADGDYLYVRGNIVAVDAARLRFDGVVETRVSHINGGATCLRTGEVDFVATGDRRFWRMQDLINCDGVVTDYVDIYFE